MYIGLSKALPVPSSSLEFVTDNNIDIVFDGAVRSAGAGGARAHGAAPWHAAAGAALWMLAQMHHAR